MKTDPQRLRRNDPGDPDVCNVYSLHKIFTPDADVKMINEECRKAGIGCVDCKKKLAANLNEYFAPFREKRAELVNNQDKVEEILNDGARRARVIADQTIEEVHEAIGMMKPKA